MAMQKSLIRSFEYPLLRSIYSGKPVKYTEWLDELKKDYLPDATIIEIIYFFQFMISCILKSLSFLGIRGDLMNIADGFWKKRSNFTRIYFQKANEYEFLTVVFHAIDRSSKYFKYGLCEDTNNTKKFYESIGNCVDICFTNENIGTKKLKKYISNICKENKNNNLKELEEIAGDAEFPILNFDALFNLFIFFERVLSLFSNKKNIEIGNETKIATNHQTTNFIEYLESETEISNMTEILIMSLLGINNNLETIHYDNANILDTINTAENNSHMEHEETRKLITDKAFEIANEIIHAFGNTPLKYRDKSINKLWMLARHPEFINPLEIMIKNRIIIEKPDYYSFQYKAKKGYGLNILAYCIFKYADLSKFAERSKRTKEYNNDGDEYKGYFTYRVYEPFSIAFNWPNLENNIRNDKKPFEFDNFVEKAGLSCAKEYGF